MFIGKVAFITQAELPEDFWDKVIEATVYHDDSDGAYFKIDAKHTKVLKDMGILSYDEVKDIVYGEVGYIMMYVPA